MAMLLQENSTHAVKYMHLKYRTAPFFLRCHLGPQYQYLGLCLASVNACNSHLQTGSVTFAFYPPHLYPSLPPSILEHRWAGESNHNFRQSAFFTTSILYEIISRNNEYPRSNCSSCTAARETVDDGLIHLYIFPFRKESSVSKASYTLPGYTKKSNKNNNSLSSRKSETQVVQD